MVFGIERSFHGDMILKKDSKHGLERITLIKNNLYLSNQSHHFKTMIDPSVIVETKNSNKNILPINQLLHHAHEDISGLDYHNNYL